MKIKCWLTRDDSGYYRIHPSKPKYDPEGYVVLSEVQGGSWDCPNTTKLNTWMYQAIESLSNIRDDKIKKLFSLKKQLPKGKNGIKKVYVEFGEEE